MRDLWYADKRDLIKWGVLFRLAERYEAKRVVQLAYYRPSTFGALLIDGQKCEIPQEVIAHFRNVMAVGGVKSNVCVTVFDLIFEGRERYQQAVLSLLPAFAQERCIVFLDPDTGLAPRRPSFNHVLVTEAKAIWDAIKCGDIFAFYQHQTNRSGKPWIDSKRVQLANAINLEPEAVKSATGLGIASDVVIFFAQKPKRTLKIQFPIRRRRKL